MQISEVVDGFVSDDEADDYVAEEDFDEFDEEDDDDGQGGSKALTKKLEELKNPRWSSSTPVGHFDKMRKAYEKEGYKSPAYNQGAARPSAAEMMTIRFTVKTIERLCDMLRSRSTTCAATSARSARSWSTSAACRRSTSSRPSRPTC
jgi:RNA polymerase primary sigma factor